MDGRRGILNCLDFVRGASRVVDPVGGPVSEVSPDVSAHGSESCCQLTGQRSVAYLTGLNLKMSYLKLMRCLVLRLVKIKVLFTCEIYLDIKQHKNILCLVESHGADISHCAETRLKTRGTIRPECPFPPIGWC